jgi:hypothetical protein
VLCRGVLNDLLEDDARQLALTSFASWLRDGGTLLVDVRDRAASLERYARGRTLERIVRRGQDTLTFTSRASMGPYSDLLQVTERWTGTAGGAAVAHEDCFTMRTWSKESFERFARSGGFRKIMWLDPGTIGARSDRLVALAGP